MPDDDDELELDPADWPSSDRMMDGAALERVKREAAEAQEAAAEREREAGG